MGQGRTLALVTAVLAMTACATPFEGSSARKECNAKGGAYIAVGQPPIMVCDYASDYPDGGKPCRSRSECIAGCRTIPPLDIADASERKIGMCQWRKNLGFGCFTFYVEPGVARGPICIDPPPPTPEG